jgi:hypothetical protein
MPQQQPERQMPLVRLEKEVLYDTAWKDGNNYIYIQV